jgi:hypothetical protein
MDELTLEQRRCERLRNLLSPAYTLAQFLQEDNEDGKLDNIIKDSADKVLEVWPMIEKALDPNATLEELNQLYSNPENRR